MKNSISKVMALGVVFGVLFGAGNALAANTDKIDLTGDWYLVVLNSNNQYLLSFLNTDIRGNPIYILKQNGHKLIGTCKGKKCDLNLQGVVSDKDVELTGTAWDIPARFEGKFEDGTINGKIYLGFEEANFMMKKQ